MLPSPVSFDFTERHPVSAPILAAAAILIGQLVSVEVPPEAESLRASVREQAERARAGVEGITGLTLDGPIRVVVVPDDRSFEREVGSPPAEHVLAVAIPDEAKAVIRGDRLAAYTGNDLGIALRHEICHIVLHARIHGHLPSWWDEGVAEWVAGRAAEAADDLALRRRAARGRLIPLDTIDYRMPGDAEEARFAYFQSGAFVGFVEEQGGAGTIREILRREQAGQPLPQAFEELSGSPPAEWFRRFEADLARRYSIFDEIGKAISIPLIMALLCLAAYARYRWRRRKILAAMDEEDEGLV